MQHTLLRLNALLTQFYKNEGGRFSRVPELTLGMLGNKNHPLLSAKANQYLGLLFFVKQVLEEIVPAVGGDARAWATAAGSLVSLWEAMRTMPWHLTERDRGD